MHNSRSLQPCRFFKRGDCHRGSDCNFSHDPNFYDVMAGPVGSEMQQGLFEWVDGIGLVNTAGSTQAQSGAPGPIEGLDGNWRCAMCQNINFPKRNTCHKCLSDKPHFADLEQRNLEIAERRMTQAAMRAAPKEAWKPPLSKANWKCATCEFINPHDKKSCGQCDEPFGSTTQPETPQFFNPETEQLYDPSTGLYFTQSTDGTLQQLPVSLNPSNAQPPAPMPMMVPPMPMMIAPPPSPMSGPGGKRLAVIDPTTGQMSALPVPPPAYAQFPVPMAPPSAIGSSSDAVL